MGTDTIKRCRICNEPIPPERLHRQPHTVTCNQDHAAENQYNLRRKSALAATKRKRAARKGKTS